MLEVTSVLLDLLRCRYLFSTQQMLLTYSASCPIHLCGSPSVQDPPASCLLFIFRRQQGVLVSDNGAYHVGSMGAWGGVTCKGAHLWPAKQWNNALLLTGRPQIWKKQLFRGWSRKSKWSIIPSGGQVSNGSPYSFILSFSVSFLSFTSVPWIASCQNIGFWSSAVTFFFFFFWREIKHSVQNKQ